MAAGLHRRPPLSYLPLALLIAHAAAQVCDIKLHNTPCGPANITRDDCEASKCCFDPLNPGVGAPSCFYPANAEIIAYLGSSLVQAKGLASFNGSTGPSSGNSTTCEWGLPAQEPSPRLDSNSQSWGLGWTNLHWIEALEMMAADAEEGFDLVLYGDSITEFWRGTSGGLPYGCTGCHASQGVSNWDNATYISWEMRAVLDDTLAASYKTGVMAIAGDQIGHLWWRMLNGQLPRKHPPKVAMVLIGTNDLTALGNCTYSEDEMVDAVANITGRFSEVLGLMRQSMPDTEIVVQGLYPRGADFDSHKFVWPNRFTFALGLLNAHYERLTESDPKMHYIYCGRAFLTPTQDGINEELMPDGLHPAVMGLKVVAQCLQPLVDSLMPSINGTVATYLASIERTPPCNGLQ